MNKDYFDKRLAAWKIVDEHKTLKPEIKEMLKKEIIKYEREEYDAFKKWLANETTFDVGSKSIIINDFMLYRPTLGPVERSDL